MVPMPSAKERSTRARTLADSLDSTQLSEVLFERLESADTGTLLLYGEGDVLHSAIWIERGQPSAALADDCGGEHNLATLLLPVFGWTEGRFEFMVGQDLVGEHAVLRGPIDPLPLITAAARACTREHWIERAVERVERSLIQKSRRLDADRYAFTPQERSVLAAIELGLLELDDIRKRTGVPEHVLRRVLFVLTVTCGIALVPKQRAISGTIRRSQPPGAPPQAATPEQNARTQPAMQAQSARTLPALPAQSPAIGETAAGVDEQELPIVHAKAPAARVPSHATISPRSAQSGQRAPASQRSAPATSARSPRTTSARPGQTSSAQPPAATSARPTQTTSGRPAQTTSARPTQTTSGRPTQTTSGRPTQTTSARPAQATNSARPTPATSQRAPAPTTSQRPATSSQPPVNDLRVRREQSEVLWAKVDTFAIRSEFGAALEVAREAATVFPPTPEHDAMVAWLMLQHGGCHESVQPQVMRCLDRAHRRDPLCEQVIYYKGLVFNLIGDIEQAHEEFQRVLMIKPDHAGANREIRIYEMRKAHARTESSFLRRLLTGRPKGG